tara:strand:- start:3121 stop:3822 length:702 start_codon:yes stop_codon:yes gene_type:complete
MDICNKIKNIYKEIYGFDEDLDMLHKLLNTNKLDAVQKNFYKTIPIFGKTDRQSCFVKDFYTYYDNDKSLNNLYIKFINNKIKPLFKENKLIIQKTPNIRVHIPNNSNIGKRKTDPDNKIIGLHYDSEFGHPNEEINFILAITDMFDSNSIYYEPKQNSGLKYENYNNIQLKKEKIWYGDLNQCYHYNKINKTNKTRISIDFRIIPFSKFKETKKKSATSNKKFIIGDYYIVI